MALPDAEPLIHFALNCGAKGCPPIKTYTPKVSRPSTSFGDLKFKPKITTLDSVASTCQDIDGQLRTAAEAFLENDDACVVDCGKREVRLSQIFKWYKADFGGTDEKVVQLQQSFLCRFFFQLHSYIQVHRGECLRRNNLKNSQYNIVLQMTFHLGRTKKILLLFFKSVS